MRENTASITPASLQPCALQQRLSSSLAHSAQNGSRTQEEAIIAVVGRVTEGEKSSLNMPRYCERYA